MKHLLAQLLLLLAANEFNLKQSTEGEKNWGISHARDKCVGSRLHGFG